jgi:hypothetical protein
VTWAPGQSGNPNGYSGPRNRRRHEVFQIIKGLGHKDALVTLSTLAHESQDEGIKIAAAAALAPYCHPKLQATPTPRFVENPIEVPDFTSIEIAEAFLGKIAVLVARGELDIQSGLELSTLTKTWLDTQYSRKSYELKEITAYGGEPDQTIRIEGGLPALPGTNITMPTLDAKPATNGHAALAPPTDAVPQIAPDTRVSGDSPPNESTNGQGST